ncbi:MAG: flagellar biosynthetic protein FliO, partial [Rhodospirillales bacterium]|nr:flagellar biosynthetic protein FliO [Rhodospirillales bacterium]
RTAGRIGKPRRLSIEETIPIDSRRRLILVRRDDKEHLLMIGGGNDIVVEDGIPSASTDGEAPADFKGALRKAEQATRTEPVLGGADRGYGEPKT